MKVEIKIQDVKEPYAVIYTPEVTGEIQAALAALRDQPGNLIGSKGERRYVIAPDDIVKAAVEDERTYVYTSAGRFCVPKRLYELKARLGRAFVQISKSVIVRISACESVETGFGGMLALRLKDGSKEYVSRHYVPDFKKSIGF